MGETACTYIELVAVASIGVSLPICFPCFYREVAAATLIPALLPD